MWTYFVVLLIIFWTALYFYFTRKFNHWKNKKVPYILPMPFFGSAFKMFTFRENIGEFTRKLYESTTKPFIGFFICDEPYLLIRDPELIKSILIKDFNSFSNRTIANNYKDDPMGSYELFMMKTPEWRDVRRKLTPVFTSGKMKSMFKLVYESGMDLLKYLEKEVSENPLVDVLEVSGKYTTDAITSTSFGINANCFKDHDAEFRKVSRRLFDYTIWERAISTSCYFTAPNLVKWLKLKFIDEESATFLRNAFWTTMKEREESRFVRNDLIDILIEMKNEENSVSDPNKLDGDKLVAQATQFFVAGFETTSLTITFALYELANNKEIQKTVRQEITQVINMHGEISYNSLQEMNYLDMCIKETLRKYPVVVFLDRKCNADYQIPGTDVILEKGSPVYIPTWGLHSDHKYFPNPEQFDPMRFTEENIKTRPPFVYLPFGEGPRNCIGARFGTMSSKSGLALILSNFEVDLCDETLHPMRINPKGIFLTPATKLILKFKKLDNKIYENGLT